VGGSLRGARIAIKIFRPDVGIALKIVILPRSLTRRFCPKKLFYKNLLIFSSSCLNIKTHGLVV